MKLRQQKVLTISPASFWLGLFFIIPLCIILFYSFLQRGTYGGIEYIFTFENYERVFDPLYIKPVITSFLLALINTVICLILGYPLAWFIAMHPSNKWKTVLLFLVILPFWTNFLVRTYAWMIILRTEGLLNNFLIWINLINEPLELLYTQKAVVIGLVYGYLPFMVLPLYASIEKLDKNLLQASKDLGANSFKTFLNVSLPLTRSGVVAGSILVFVPSIGAFITPDLLGGAKNLMIGNLIKEQFLSARDWPFGSALSVILMAIVLIMLMLYVKFGLEKESIEKVM